MRKINAKNQTIGISILLICTAAGFVFPIAAKWILAWVTIFAFLGRDK